MTSHAASPTMNRPRKAPVPAPAHGAQRQPLPSAAAPKPWRAARARPTDAPPERRRSSAASAPDAAASAFLAALDSDLSFYFAALQASDGAASLPGACADTALGAALDEFRAAATVAPPDPARTAAAREALRARLRARGDGVAELAEALHAAHTAGSEATASAAGGAAYLQKKCYVGQRMQCVLPLLFIGGYHPAADRAVLQAAGVSHVCCCIAVAPRFPDDFVYLTLPAEDTVNYPIAQHFDESFAFIDGAVSQGRSVLVHCGGGISRAPTILAAYLIRRLGVGAAEALKIVQRARSCASPNRGFKEQLAAFAAACAVERGAAVVVPGGGAAPAACAGASSA